MAKTQTLADKLNAEAAKEEKEGRLLLKQLEQTITNFMGQMWDAAKALTQIKDEGLYSHDHLTFEEYVKSRWNKTRDWAYKLIQWYEVNQEIGNEDGNDAISITAATQLAPVKKSHPKKVNAVVKKAEAIAKQKGHKTPTSTDFKDAKAVIIELPQKVAAKITKEKVEKDFDDFKFTVAVSKDDESEVKEILETGDTQIKKYKGKFLTTTKDPAGFMKVVSKLMTNTITKMEMTITVERVPVKSRTVKKTKAA
jgi:hypothetical protein